MRLKEIINKQRNLASEGLVVVQFAVFVSPSVQLDEGYAALFERLLRRKDV